MEAWCFGALCSPLLELDCPLLLLILDDSARDSWPALQQFPLEHGDDLLLVSDAQVGAIHVLCLHPGLLQAVAYRGCLFHAISATDLQRSANLPYQFGYFQLASLIYT